jgi:hypothetical protein
MLSNTQRRILSGIAIGIVAGIVIGLLGAYLNLPAGVRGGLIGAVVVVGLRAMQSKYAREQEPEV